jgi:hypothetical protein
MSERNRARPGEQSRSEQVRLSDYREYVPASARAFISTLTGQRSPITEGFFTPSELDVLRRAAEQASARQSNQIRYGDYGERDPYSEGPRHLRSALFDRGGSLANTLGMARVERAPSGEFVITDRYDFAATPQQMEQFSGVGGLARLLAESLPYGPMGALNALGNYVAPAGEGRPVEIRLPPPRRSTEDR